MQKWDGVFQFSHFLVPSWQRNHRKSCYCHGKQNFRAPAWTSAKCYCGNKAGSPELVVSLHIAPLDSHSQRGTWFILTASRACHVIMWKYCSIDDDDNDIIITITIIIINTTISFINNPATDLWYPGEQIQESAWIVQQTISQRKYWGPVLHVIFRLLLHSHL